MGITEIDGRGYVKIAIDGRYINDHFPGIGRYVYNLIQALSQLETDDTIVVLHNRELVNSRYDVSDLASKNAQILPVDVPTISPREQWEIPSILKRQRVGLFHSPYYVKPYFVSCPSVVTIYDTIPCHYPQYLPSRGGRWMFALTMRLALYTSKRIITLSQAAKNDLIHFFRVSAAKIRVIPAAANQFLPPSGSLNEAPPFVQELRPYILYVGINKPHKNLVNLIRAYAKAKVNHRLVLAGHEDPRFPKPRQLVRDLALGSRVQFLGPVKEDELHQLYRWAEFFAFPSLAEGFGLPVLEAMASGLPVIVSAIPSLKEIVSDAGILVDPFDVDGLSRAIEGLATDPSLRQELAQKARVRASQFSWRRAAWETLLTYKDALSR